MYDNHSDHSVSTLLQFVSETIGTRMSPLQQEELRELTACWHDATSRRFDRDMTFALLNGGRAGEISSTKPKDNPYSTRAFRWAWMTGFDLGRRLDQATDELRDCYVCLRQIADLVLPQVDQATLGQLVEAVRQLKTSTTSTEHARSSD